MPTNSFERLHATLHRFHYLSYPFFIIYCYFMLQMFMAADKLQRLEHFAMALLSIGFFLGLHSLKARPEQVSLSRKASIVMIKSMLIIALVLLVLAAAIYVLKSHFSIALGLSSLSIGLIAMAKEMSHWLEHPICKGDNE